MGTAAYCPGRVCLVGEDLDWTVGPSVLAAIDRGVTVRAQYTRDRTKKGVRSGWPIDEYSPWPIADRTPAGSRLSHVIAVAQTFSRKYDADLSDLHIEVSSNLPAAAGLSSSAAVILATIEALSSLTELDLSREEVISLGYHVEARVLGTGAGQMDFYGCAQGGVTFLDSSSTPPTVNETYSEGIDLQFVIVDTGVTRRTGDVIRTKRERWARSEHDIVQYVEHTRRLVAEMVGLLRAQVVDPEQFGGVLSEAHTLLRERMHSSNELLDECVARLLKVGAYGAKLTGTGHGGCVFGVFPGGLETDRIAGSFADLGVSVIPTRLSSPGLARSVVE